jgi:hypothetical protein
MLFDFVEPLTFDERLNNFPFLLAAPVFLSLD